jgi:hypothetical protein
MCTLNFQNVHDLPLCGDLPDASENFTLRHWFICTGSRNSCRSLHCSCSIAHCKLSKGTMMGEWWIWKDSEGNGSICGTIQAFEMRGPRNMSQAAGVPAELRTNHFLRIQVQKSVCPAATLLTCTRDVSGSNHHRGIDYCDWGIRRSPDCLQANDKIDIRSAHICFLSHPVEVTNHFTIWRFTVWVVDSIGKWTTKK